MKEFENDHWEVQELDQIELKDIQGGGLWSYLLEKAAELAAEYLFTSTPPEAAMKRPLPPIDSTYVAACDAA